MKRLSLTALSAGLGLALLAAPLAMAQPYPDHHAIAGHDMHAPAHRAVSTHNRTSAHMSHAAHMQPREVSVRHHIAMPLHHMAPHHN